MSRRAQNKSDDDQPTCKVCDRVVPKVSKSSKYPDLVGVCQKCYLVQYHAVEKGQAGRLQRLVAEQEKKRPRDEKCPTRLDIMENLVAIVQKQHQMLEDQQHMLREQQILLSMHDCCNKKSKRND